MVRGWGALLVAMLALCMQAPGAGAVSIDVTGPDEVVYDYPAQHCYDFDQADGPARAFRDASGQLQIWMSGANTRMVGPTFNSLTHDCNRVLVPNQDSDPSQYDDRNGWLTGHYTADGQTIYALVHSEYHGIRHPGWCQGEPFIKCRYNSATFAKSTDGGATFQHAPGAAALVAALPYRYVPGDGRYGYFAPSNIVQWNGWYYSLLLVSSQYREQRAGTCVMRTQNLDDPKSWRAWDGDGYNVRFVDPYRESPEPTGRHVCEPVSPTQIRDMNRSLTWNTLLNKWVVTGTTSKYDATAGAYVVGFYFSVSDDLINWTDRKLIFAHTMPASYVCGGPLPRAYPSIIDHGSTDRNFATTDGTAYLYFNENIYQNCINTSTTNMLRVPIQFTP
jgi:hypothetical protein